MIPSQWRARFAGVIAIGMAFSLAMVGPTRAVQVTEIDIDLTVDPNAESMTVVTRLHVAENTGDEELLSYFCRPTRMEYLRDVESGRDVSYKIEPVSLPQYGVSQLTMNVARFGRTCTLEVRYVYEGADFYGYAMNPTTLDNLVLGQITRESVYSSHLYYYPFTETGPEQATIAMTVPLGWLGVSGGDLQTWESLENGQSRFVYTIPYASGLLPYPIAAFPYVVEETVYRDRVLVAVYSSSGDARLAREKLGFVTETVLPFLEELMGDYPLSTLRIVEVFPKEGNTGLAARGVVMLSERMWFSETIGEAYGSLPAIVLVDECAHQWNAYHVQLPNYLAEGVSEYTDNLFIERFVDPGGTAARMALYREAYTGIVDLLARLKPLKNQGMSVEQAAAELGLSVEAVSPYWPYANWDELPISDPRVFPTLYFLKGALAIDALRTELGDECFFRGFRSLFSQSSNEPITLDDYRQCFESASDRDLGAFFTLWYDEPGLPGYGAPRPPSRRDSHES